MSENIAVQCGHCGQKLAAPPKLAGRRVACPKCKAPIDVPAPLPVAEAAEEPPRMDGLLDDEFSMAPLPPGPAKGDLPPLPVTSATTAGNTLPRSSPAATPSRRPAARDNRKNTIAFIAVIAACCVVGGAFAAFLLMGGGVGNDLRYLPDNCDAIVTFDFQRLLASKVGAQLKANGAPMLQRLQQTMRRQGDATPEDFGRCTIGIKFDGTLVGVVHFNRPVGDDDFTGPTARGVRKQIGSYHLISRDGTEGCKIDNYTIAMGSENALSAALNRGGVANISPDLKAAMSAVNFSAQAAVAYQGSSLQKMPGMANGLSMLPGGGDGIRGAALQVDVDSEIRLRAVVLCKDDATADQLKKMAEGGLAVMKTNPKMPPAAAKIMNSLSISNSGNVVSGNVTIDSETISSLQSSIPFGAGMAGGASAPLGGAH